MRGDRTLRQTISSSSERFRRRARIGQFVNGSPTTLSVLKNLGDELVDLHGPHDHQSLLSPEKQLELARYFAGAGECSTDEGEVFQRCSHSLAEHATLNTAETAREQEFDLLRHQVGEIRAANRYERRKKLKSKAAIIWPATAND